MQAIVRDKIIFVFLLLTAILLVVSFVLTYFKVDALSYPLILHFNPYQGVDLMGVKADVWGIVAMGFLVVVINTVLARTLFYRERIITYIFLATNVLLALLAFIGIAHIISLN